MATNVKFLTGSNTDNLPAYSQNTIGQIYFIVDTTNKDSSLWNGKLIYDSPQGRLIMRQEPWQQSMPKALWIRKW